MSEEFLREYLFKNFTLDEGIIPYLSNKDFAELNKKTFCFTNSFGEKVVYFYYFYRGSENGKTVLFLPGVAPGHKAYVREIERFCKSGYKVLTLDYSGVGESGKDGFKSLFSPTSDTLKLIEKLNLKDFFIVGHSLGGFTALNVLNTLGNIEKAVIISGFYDTIWLLEKFTDKEKIIDYENKLMPKYAKLNNLEFLKKTESKILFIHSIDDVVVPYEKSTGNVKGLDNKNLSVLTVNGKGHNPNYSVKALEYMNKTFADYNRLINDGTLDNLKKKKEFMKDKSPLLMTVQDQEIINGILSFLEK